MLFASKASLVIRIGDAVVYSGPIENLSFVEANDPETLPPPCRSVLEALATIGRCVAEALQHQVRTAREDIDAAIAFARSPHPDVFAGALRSMAELSEDGLLPTAGCIFSTAAALEAAERQLPPRGAIARWQRDKALTAAVDRYKDVYGSWNEWHIARDAVHRYLRDRVAGIR